MSMTRKLKKKLVAATAATIMLGMGAANVNAFPLTDNGTVEVGSATGPGIGSITFNPSGTNLYTISGNTLINWDTFGIPQGCTMTFDTNGNIVVNQVTGASYSPIEGILAQQNGGHLFLINPNGITVASGAQISGTAITLAAVQTLSATQFDALCAGNTVTLTPAGNVLVETIYNSVSSQYNVLGTGVSVPPDEYLSMGGTRKALTGDTSVTLKNNSLTVGGDTPTPPGPVNPTDKEKAQLIADGYKSTVNTLIGSQVLNDDASKAAQEAMMHEQEDNTPTVKQEATLTGIQDHVYIVQTGAEQNNTGLDVGKLFDGLNVAEATTRSKHIAKQYVDAVRSGDTTKTAELKSDLLKANEELNGAKTAELAKQKEAEAAKEAAIKEAQEKLDQARKEGFDAYSALLKARNDLSNAEEKAEQAARDYLLALKSGDKDTIAAFKEELQKANDALLEAKRNEEAAQQRIQDAGANIARAQAELNNAQNNFTYSGGAGGENQQTTQQQTVGQQTTQQTVEQPVQQQSSSETNITTQDPLKMKVTSLEQKESELTKQWEQQDKAAREAFKEYFEAKKSGASQEELDRIEARHTEAMKEADRLDKERETVKAELQAARTEAELAKMTPAELERKEAQLAKQMERSEKDARGAFGEYVEAKERGASQEELDRIEARHVEALKEADRLDKEREAVSAKLEEAHRAELRADREAAKAAETQQQTVEQPAQQQSGGETSITTQDTLKMKVTALEQKVNDLDNQAKQANSASGKALLEYLKAKDSGASQEEIDRLDAKHKELSDARNALLAERRAAKAELEAAREAANAAETQQQTVEQTTQQQSGGEAAQKPKEYEISGAETAEEHEAFMRGYREAEEEARKEEEASKDPAQTLNNAQQKTKDAEANAEKVARDYLLALKSGDKYTIDAFKEELQKANDALVTAKREEEAARANATAAE